MMESPDPLNEANTVRAKSLQDLPDEILLQIFSSIDQHRDVRIMGYIPDDPPPSPPEGYLFDDFRVINCWLRNIALTCRRFAALLPEIQLHASILHASAQSEISDPSVPYVYPILHRLFEKPELLRHVKQLRVHLLDSEYAFKSVDHEDAFGILKSLSFPSSLQEHHRETLCNQGYGRGLSKLLLALLPNLQRLCIVDPWFNFNFELSETLPITHTLRYLKIEGLEPPTLNGIGVFKQLQTLDLSIRLQYESPHAVLASSDIYAHPSMAKNTHGIKHLRLDFEVRTIGVWKLAWRICMFNVLKGFPNLETLCFCAESSAGKNPYRSVRAFRAYQANIQAYPEAPPPPIDMEETVWNRPIHDARTEVTDYQCLVDNLVHLRPTLKTLQLPGGFWTLPGSLGKPIPRFKLFERLEKLILPQSAIISIMLDNMQMNILEVFEGDFELSATDALPLSLQHLKIFDVDETFLTSTWLSGLFEEQKNHVHWPNFHTLEILMGPMCSDEALEVLITRQKGEAFWSMADAAAFKVVVGRDEEGPENMEI